MFDEGLLELMPHEVTLKPPAGKNQYGEKSWGAALTPAPHAHIEYTERIAYENATGHTVYRDGTVYLDGVYPVKDGWYLGLPQPGGPEEAVQVVAVAQITDEDGWHHTELGFGPI